MIFIDFLILQFIAHLLAEFIAQSDSVKEEKGNNITTWFKHFIIIILLSWILTFQLNLYFVAVTIGVFHLIVDWIKTILSKKEAFKKLSFLIDQSLHILAIIVVVTLFERCFKPDAYFTFNTETLLIIGAYIFCLKPTNIIIKEILKAYNIQIPKQSEQGKNGIPNVGKLIGNVERFLTLTLILHNQYETVGFIIAAKSILRFNENNKDGENKSEYVLVGTLLSFGIALSIGLIVQLYK